MPSKGAEMTKFVNPGMTNFVQKRVGIFPQDGISVRMTTGLLIVDFGLRILTLLPLFLDAQNQSFC